MDMTLPFPGAWRGLGPLMGGMVAKAGLRWKGFRVAPSWSITPLENRCLGAMIPPTNVTP